MPPLKTPICDFGTNAKDFKLNSTDNKLISLNDIKGDTGTLIVFICNHCPYVKAVIKDIIEDCKNLEKLGVKAVTISSNDPINNCFNIRAVVTNKYNQSASVTLNII